MDLGRAVDEFVHDPVEVLAALTTIAGAGSAAFKTGRRFWTNLLARLRSKPIVPTETLRVIQGVQNSFWGMASVAGAPAMQVVFRGHVTDISGKENRVLGAHISKPLTHAMMLLLQNNHDARRPQVLEARECAGIDASFFVQPVVGVDGKPWRATVIFVDQYGNAHKIRNCVFRSLNANITPQPKEPEEFPDEMADPIEREVVSILKSELSHYSICGRRSGGLGSIHIVYQGRPFTGVGGDSWPPNSVNQVVVSDPEAASLKSDNLEALVGFYRGLSSDDEKARFVKALLHRLDASRGYLAVSYFIVAVLWRVGAFAEALQKAKSNLPENESRVFGFSNVLMLLNGLLRYRYPDFTNQMLDEIERMTHGLQEHTFLIPAKIAAIRARRVPTPRAAS